MEKFIQYERSGQEIPQVTVDTFGGLSEGLPGLGLFSPTNEVSRFLEHQHPD
jgi:hypothetical protein